MPMTFRQNATAAHLAPFVLFMALNLVPGWLRVENSELPWFQRAPEHWVYPLQTLLCGALLVSFRSHYRLHPWRGWGLAIALGLLGFVLWIAPGWAHDQLVLRGWPPPFYLEWLGVVERTQGFDPGIFSQSPGWEAAVIGVRMIRMVVVVPLIEEIFWRGFLMRHLAADERPWTAVPFGEHRRHVFWVVTVLVMLAHHPADYAAAFVWGALVYFVAVRTRSLGACVLMHAMCNLVLGLYVLRTHRWGFW